MAKVAAKGQTLTVFSTGNTWEIRYLASVAQGVASGVLDGSGRSQSAQFKESVTSPYQKWVARIRGGPELPLITSVASKIWIFFFSQPFGALASSLRRLSGSETN